MPLFVKLSFCFFLLYPAHPYFKKAVNGANVSRKWQKKTVIGDTAVFNKALAADSNLAMVPLTAILSTFYKDIKYATAENFTGVPLYIRPKLYVRLPVARALQQVLNDLKQHDLTLLFYDAYRPYSVTCQMWELVKDSRYAANPAFGSNHNRGTAVDVTLAHLKTGTPVEMPTSFDDFTEKAHHNYNRLPAEILSNRQLLKTVMLSAGFTSLSTEWWHYSYPVDGGKYALLDLSFDQLQALAYNL